MAHLLYREDSYRQGQCDCIKITSKKLSKEKTSKAKAKYWVGKKLSHFVYISFSEEEHSVGIEAFQYHFQ